MSEVELQINEDVLSTFLGKTELNGDQIKYAKSVSFYDSSFRENIRPHSDEQKRIYHKYLVRKIYRNVVSGKICSMTNDIILHICKNLHKMEEDMEDIDREFFSYFLHNLIDLYLIKHNIEKKKYIESIITCEFPISEKHTYESISEDGIKVKSVSICPTLERESNIKYIIHDIELREKLINIKKTTNELSNIIELYIKDLIFKSENIKQYLIKLELILKGTENQKNITLTAFYICLSNKKLEYKKILKEININISKLHEYRKDELKSLKYIDMCYLLHGDKISIPTEHFTDEEGKKKWIQFQKLMCYLHNEKEWGFPYIIMM